MSATASLSPSASLHLVGEELAQSLAAAVQAGLTDKAAEIAVELSKLKVKCDISLSSDSHTRRSRDTEFGVKVHVEDRLSDKCLINITVKASDTIGDLKRKMMLLYNLPVEIQRWIVGKKIYSDETRLQQCGVRKSGHTLYLYLVTARSVGLNKASYEAQLKTISMLQKTESLAPPFSNRSSHAGDSLEQTSVVPILSSQNSQNISMSGSSPGSLRIQEMLQSPHLSGSNPPHPNGTPGTPSENVMTHASPGLSADIWGPNSVSSNNIGMAAQQNVPIPPAQGPPASESRGDDETPEEGWDCPTCTFRNLPMWPGCEVCNQQRPDDYQVPENYRLTERELHLIHEEQELERLTRQEIQDGMVNQQWANYHNLLATEDLDLVPNQEPFQCAICFDDIGPGEGIVLRECLHQFCRECLAGAVQHCEEAILTCPYQDDQYSCQAVLLEREIRALVPEDEFYKYLQRGLNQAEVRMDNSYHCKTANCPGWCIYEDQINFFDCPVCHKLNCLTCKAIHEGKNCQQYQNDLRAAVSNDKSARETLKMLKDLVSGNEAMHCPQCSVIVQKKGGCDWIKCSICKTEICWVTRGPRWGPGGEGDISGGCQCRVNGRKCHPQCQNCH